MQVVRRLRRWEAPTAILCAILCFVPIIRVPATILLLCLLPGLAVVRHGLGESSLARSMVLGSLVSLCAVPAIAIPASLLWGRPTAWIAAVSACVIAVLTSLQPGRVRSPATRTGPEGSRAPCRLPERSFAVPMALILALVLAMQIGASLATHPDEATIRWKGLPDMIFFQGIHAQIAQQTPPLDPENGARPLIHNWIYHFGFALLEILGGLSIPAAMRVASAWMALTLAGLVVLVAADLFRRPAGGLFAVLLLLTSGEGYWLLRSAARGELTFAAMPWAHSPFGITMLFGWYNLAPLAAALGAWYWLARHRETGSATELGASLAMCVALAFFHPVFFGVFMIGFCFWLGWLWLVEGPRQARLLYLITPLPFFLFYKLPYYGLTMPPPVVHFDLSRAGMLDRAQNLILWMTIPLALGLVGLLVARGRAGPLWTIVGSSILLTLFVKAPNPHWFNDLLYVALALTSGVAVAWLSDRSRTLGAVVIVGTVALGGFAFALHAQVAFGTPMTYSNAERAAGEWIESTTNPDDLFAAMPNSPAAFIVVGLGGRRLVHGWTTHQLDFHHDARLREEEVTELVTTDSPERAEALAREYGVRYVFRGPYERSQSGGAGLAGDCFRPAFGNGEIEILRFNCTNGS